jgi:hypothetical protein
MTEEQKKALEVVADMVFDGHGYDYVDDTIEVRLYGEVQEFFSAILERKWDEKEKNRQVRVL